MASTFLGYPVVFKEFAGPLSDPIVLVSLKDLIPDAPPCCRCGKPSVCKVIADQKPYCLRCLDKLADESN